LFTLKKSENSFLVNIRTDSPRDLNPKVPQSLSDLVMECVRASPAKRPQMQDVTHRLEIIQFTLQRGGEGAVMHA
jgi:hypothetical protein